MRIEPRLDSKPKEASDLPVLRAEPLGEIVLSRVPRTHAVSGGPPRAFKYAVVTACAFIGWSLWVYMSASLFLAAFNRGDRVSVESYVDRTSLSRSIEAGAITAIERERQYPKLLASLAGVTLGAVSNLLPTMELLNFAIPAGATVRMIVPNGLTEFLVIVADPQKRGNVLVFSLVNFRWRLTGFAF